MSTRRRGGFTLADGDVIDYDVAVLATGATPNRTGYRRARTCGACSRCETGDNAASIVALASAGSQAVIIGSSFIGLEAASRSSSADVRVTVIAPEEIPFAPPVRIGNRRDVSPFARGARRQFSLGIESRTN